jgi:outer membrane protein OmpA-like peptidoglycan-associated protein
VMLIVLTGCGATVPAELRDARQAYDNASKGPAATLTPAELQKARTSLDEAEAAWKDDPTGFHTLDLAYVAQRKAEIAEVKAGIAVQEAANAKAQKDMITVQAKKVQQTEAELQSTRSALHASQEVAATVAGQLSQEQEARKEAEKRASDLQASLAKLAAVKQEERGLVITLSGSVLFRTDEWTLLPEARHRLDEVATALLETKDRTLVVEGHTDSHGSARHNQDLSQRRAEAVRDFLVGRGYPAAHISAAGYGSQRPVADNKTAEGRANNRRVEIVVTPVAKPVTDDLQGKNERHETP